ncbi:MAG: phytanoyl-CoA dioxygenase family protein [Gammaproteobacteria bacterium]|nr:phytanoyl-CoA dioxygenase family protein [Gammaproteobacteria bacterium]
MLAYTPLVRHDIIRDFCSRGLVVLSPESLGIPINVHKCIYESELAQLRDRKPVTCSSVPEILDILDSPGVQTACNAVLGENWAIVPFTHNTPFLSGSHDQHWHKDDNGPFNARKHRHHHAVQAELLYFPQEVREDMGPTATVPYSQYWTFNHEENQDNFAGADHLDFAYQLDGMERIPVSGPKSAYTQEDIVNRNTNHDKRLRQTVLNLNWPLNEPFEVGPLKPGSVVLYSHNLLHRGNHRRDDWNTWKDNPRFMWRFWLYRTTESTDVEPNSIDWRTTRDDLTGIERTSHDDGIAATWNYHWRWMHSGSIFRTQKSQKTSNQAASQSELEELQEELLSLGDENEPTRIGAAYKLAERSDCFNALNVLEEALHSDRESVRRAATYGLAATGSISTQFLLGSTNSPVRWIRKAAVFCLGETGAIHQEVLQRIEYLLLNDSSIYVRSVAAAALGCFVRRSASKDSGRQLIPLAVNALLDSLNVEVNRLAMDRAQGRSIKLVRPTDECDVCEGIGIDYGQDRFEPVRSAVRENVLWSVVIMCSHGPSLLGRSLNPLIETLTQIIETEENIFVAGFAMDALNRLAQRTELNEPQKRERLHKALRTSPTLPIECLARGGMPRSEIQQLSIKPGTTKLL